MASTITSRTSTLATPARPDGLNATVAMKVPCRVATTANITLEGEQTIDDIAVVADDRVLVKDQTDSTENGIYVASATNWARATDAADNGDLVLGTEVRVNYGTVGAFRWYCTAADPIVIGTDAITWGQVTGISIGDGDKGDITVTSSGTVFTIDTGAVTAGKIGTDAVTTVKIQADAVTTAKILDGNVTYAKIATAAKATAANVRAGAADVIVTPAIIESAMEDVEIDPTTWAWDAGISFLETMGGNVTIAFPTAVELGTWRTIKLVDTTGTRTINVATSAGFITLNGDNLAITTPAGTSYTIVHMYAISASEIYVTATGPGVAVT